MNHALKATAHENKIRRVANFCSAAGHRSRGALWPSFAPARITAIVKLLYSASAQIFVMANQSDDPIAGIYALSKQRVVVLARQVQEELSSWDSPDSVR